jgi:uncharacterized protein (DUF4415 family)
MKKTPNPELIDDTNPEWNDEMFDHASSVEESTLPESFKAEARRGRPPKAIKKIQLSVRYSAEVVEYFKSTGKGWQTRMDDVLKKHVESHQ